ncbi:hypothetical protein NON08_12175 [Cetobacterium somerae]|uniref:hypothetical protein n=1 Tax=Cetobacterium sp. NK01 TaxID=2993530 RepID=UPI0021171424|nr:hypothetical protein [Cetobacterium sp. NK01]MCQ8213257.1 hypothetical protein [Cetobacterium sp. NK01]
MEIKKELLIPLWGIFITSIIKVIQKQISLYYVKIQLKDILKKISENREDDYFKLNKEFTMGVFNELSKNSTDNVYSKVFFLDEFLLSLKGTNMFNDALEVNVLIKENQKYFEQLKKFDKLNIIEKIEESMSISIDGRHLEPCKDEKLIIKLMHEFNIYKVFWVNDTTHEHKEYFLKKFEEFQNNFSCKKNEIYSLILEEKLKLLQTNIDSITYIKILNNLNILFFKLIINLDFIDYNFYNEKKMKIKLELLTMIDLVEKYEKNNNIIMEILNKINSKEYLYFKKKVKLSYFKLGIIFSDFF